MIKIINVRRSYSKDEIFIEYKDIYRFIAFKKNFIIKCYHMKLYRQLFEIILRLR